MTWLKVRIVAVLSALTAILAVIGAVYGKGRSDADAKRDADDMTDAYNRERTRNEIERNSSNGDARQRLRENWRRD